MCSIPDWGDHHNYHFINQQINHMGNKSISIDLLKLNKAGVMEIKGRTGVKKCIVIPIEDNSIEVKINADNKPKAAYLNAIAWQNQDKISHAPILDQFGNSHRICLSIDKKMLDTMTEEEKKSCRPIIGNARDFDKSANAMEVPSVAAGDMDDIPF